MLHVIQADYIDSNGQGMPPFLYALGVGFPKTSNETELVNYKVNLVELRNWIDIPDDEDDIDD